MTTIKQFCSSHPYEEISEDYYYSILNGVPALLQETGWFICSEAYGDYFDRDDKGELFHLCTYMVCFSCRGRFFKAVRPVNPVNGGIFDIPSLRKEISELCSANVA